MVTVYVCMYVCMHVCMYAYLAKDGDRDDHVAVGRAVHVASQPAPLALRRRTEHLGAQSVSK